jgi:hypothetical protein
MRRRRQLRAGSASGLVTILVLGGCGPFSPSPPGWLEAHCARPLGVSGSAGAPDGLALPAYGNGPWENIVGALLRTGATYVEAQLAPGPTADRAVFPDPAIYRLRVFGPPDCRPRLEAFLHRAYPSAAAGTTDQRRDAFFDLARSCLAAIRLGRAAENAPGKPPFTAPFWIGSRENLSHVGRFDEKYIDDIVVERATGRVVASRTAFAAATIPPGGYASGVACGGGWIGTERLFDPPAG